MIKNFRVGSFNLIKNAYILETGNLYGNMTNNPKFYDSNYDKEKVKKEILKRRVNLGIDYGFDGFKMFEAKQKFKTGTYKQIDEDIINLNEDGFMTFIDEDILIIDSKYPGVVIGHSVGDCAVVMCYDKRLDVASVCHCGASEVDNRLPIATIDSLVSAYNSHYDDIITYVSACAGDSWTYDKYPLWAKDKQFWDKFISYDKGIYHINLKKAIYEQLKSRDISNIIMSPVDTILDNDFYSNYAAHYGNNKKNGRHYAGIYFKKKR